MTRKTFTKRSVTLAASLGALMLAFPALSQTAFPNKTLTMIVPFPPGGTSDSNARLVASEMSRILGQTVIIDNRAGANGMIGTLAAAKAPADGYTIVLSGVGTHAINAAIYKDQTYDPVKDFAHLTMIAAGPNAIAVNPSFPVKTLAELIDLVRKEPGKYNYASSGNGSSGHMAMELFKQRAGLEINHIPYRGGNPALQDVLGGHVPILITNADAIFPHSKEGKLRALGVTSLERNPMDPSVPSIAEAGLAGFSAVSWTGVSAPANTPPDILAKLQTAAVEAVKSPAVRDKLIGLGLVIGANSAKDFTAFVVEDVAKWGKVAKDSNIKAD